MPQPAVPTLIVTGPCGVGKSAVVSEIDNLLTDAAIPHSCFDMDALRTSYPHPPDDPFNTALGLRNLGAVWANCQASGAAYLVLADVIETAEQRADFTAAIPGATITIVRLRATAATLRQRVDQREIGSGNDWHQQRALELAAQMDRDHLEDFCIDTDDQSVAALAAAILKQCGWLPATPSATGERSV